MNTSTRSDSTHDKPDKSDKTKSRRNIRAIYLQSVTQHRASKKGGKLKSKNISNISGTQGPTPGASAYLQNEYTLVKNILTATKALEKLKTNPENASKASVGAETAAQRASQQAFKYKSQEEYYAEVLALKKSVKQLQINETLSKAKLEYYENEMSKKEQEVLALLDVKRDGEGGEIRSELENHNLRIKAYKLEFGLKRKDNELKKLKNDLKLTSLKELQTQNERLRMELSKALMNDQKILEAQEVRALQQLNGQVTYQATNSSVTQPPVPSETVKYNIAKRLQKSETYDTTDKIVSKFGFGFEQKISLHGSLRDRFDQLDARETELLEEISRLNNKLSEMPVRKALSRNSSYEENTLDDKTKVHAVRVLQSVLQGHLERSRSLNMYENEARERKQHRAKAKSRSPTPETSYRRPLSRQNSASSIRTPLRAQRSSRANSPRRSERPNSRQSFQHKPEFSDREDQDYESGDNATLRSDRSRRRLIEEKNVKEEKSGLCCSPWRSYV